MFELVLDGKVYVLHIQAETVDAVLWAEDKLDDGSPIVLQVTINKENVSSFAYAIHSALFDLELVAEVRFHSIQMLDP